MSKIGKRRSGWGFVSSKKREFEEINPSNLREHGINDVKDRSKSEALHFEYQYEGFLSGDPRLPEVLQM